MGGNGLAHACHVGRWADVDALIDAAYERFGKVDVLVNNAGMSPLYPSLSEVSEELFDKVVGVNLKGPFRLARGDRLADGRRRRRQHHQRDQHRSDPPERQCRTVRRGQGRAERPDRSRSLTPTARRSGSTRSCPGRS